MFKDLKFALRLRPFVGRIKEWSTMTWGAQKVLSGVLLVLQVGAQFSDYVPAEYKWVPAVAHGLAELILKHQAQFREPDGTRIEPKG